MLFKITKYLFTKAWLHFTCTSLRARVRTLEENMEYLEGMEPCSPDLQIRVPVLPFPTKEEALKND